MGGEQAAGVLAQVKKEQMKKTGEHWTEEVEKKIKDKILEKFEKESSAYYASARLWDDGIILPSETRKTLGYKILYRKAKIENIF